ncbi:MAG: ATP-binding protein [Verrucomicrobiales bacterium]|jgi:signal transduction histidine kinase|nr:ATP-binding protein [Verrucomicrobiales bacterium]
MADFFFADDYRLDQSPTREFYDTFLKGLVHKHNNLMGVIQGFSSLILYDESISEEVRDSAQQMQDSSKMASALNQEVLVSAGCSRCDDGSASVGDLMTFWKDKAGEICQVAGVGLQVTPRDGLPRVNGDGGKLSEIFFHLVRNAAEAAAEVSGGSVAIDLFPPGEASPGENVDLFVRNTSVTMTEEAVKKAFEPFHTSKGSEHFGLGLTTASVLSGQMGMRLGLRHADGTTTAWLAMPQEG